jgi:hypothetical protein
MSNSLPPLPKPRMDATGAWVHDEAELRAWGEACAMAEREACAQVCERLDREDTTCQGDLTDLSKFARAIRERNTNWFTAGKWLIATGPGVTLAHVQEVYPFHTVKEGKPSGDLSDMLGMVDWRAPPGAQPPSGGGE